MGPLKPSSGCFKGHPQRACRPGAARLAVLLCSQQAQTHTCNLIQERGVTFTPGKAFYRAESAQARDLVVLAASVYKQHHGQLRVLDVMSGSGMRGARYIQQAGADMVWCNDYCPDNHAALVYNLAASLGLAGEAGAGEVDIAAAVQHCIQTATSLDYPGLRQPVLQLTTSRQPNNNNTTSSSSSPKEDSMLTSSNSSSSSSWRTDANATASSSSSSSSSSSAHAKRRRVEGESHDSGHGLGSHQDLHLGSSAEAADDPLVDAATEGGSAAAAQSAGGAGVDVRAIRVSHFEANRLLCATYLAEDYFDLVDVDSFGSETMHLPAAIDSVKYGGMLYLTSTDGFSGAGKRPERSLAAYGAYLRPLPFANEQGLRMLIGSAVKEAATRGVVLQPLFSLYSFHGPVFRVLLRAVKSKEWPVGEYGFLGHCYVHSQTYKVPWKQLSHTWCRCCKASAKHEAAAGHQPDLPTLTNTSNSSSSTNMKDAPRTDPTNSSSSRRNIKAGAPGSSGPPLVLSGPMWTGSLHDRAFLEAMRCEAEAKGWRGSGIPHDSPHMVRRSRNNGQRPLEDLLDLLWEESDPHLPPWFIPVDSLAQHLTSCPSRDKLVTALRQAGFAACRCHVEVRALRTNASIKELLKVAVERCGYQLRKDSPYYALAMEP